MAGIFLNSLAVAFGRNFPPRALLIGKVFLMRPLSKTEAEKIVEITSSIFSQGTTWVFQEFDLDTGLTRLSRGLSLPVAKRKLRMWRKERLEQLLRGDGKITAYVLRVFHRSPNWNGEGTWHSLSNHWYTTQADAEAALERKREELDTPCEIVTIKTGELPGHFSVAS
jgi:hypothetical protein